MASERHVTVPIPRPRPQRPGEQRSTQIPLVEGESGQVVVMPSLHNWVEQVYKAFKQTFPTGANEVALLGVREMSRTAGETPEADTEDSYARADRPADRGPHDSKGDQTTSFNDLLFAVWTESTPEEGTKARVYACTIDPSSETSTSTGSPYLLEGKAYLTRPGQHQGKGTGLHIYTDTYGDIMISREATKSSRVFTEIKHGLVAPSSMGPRRWEFVGTEANTTFHVHWSFDYASTDRLSKNWSAGCTVLMYAKTNDIYTRFVSLVEGAANTRRIPYLVVSSAYVQLPDVWATSAADDQDKLKESAYTIRANGLVRAPAPLVGYLPSTMTFEFAQQVLQLADDVDKVSAAVGGNDVPDVDSSLANVLNLEKDNVLPRSVPGPLAQWSAARQAQRPFADDARAGLLDGLSGLSANLRSSLERACFTTVLPTERGPR